MSQFERPTQLWGWRLLVAVGFLLSLNSVILYFFIADSALMRTTSLLELGFGLLALGIAWEGWRRRSEWAWRILWAMVITLLLVGAQIFASGDAGVAVFYFAMGLIALAGQLLARGGLAAPSGAL